MAQRSIRGIRDVAECNLCTGCGICAFVQPQAIRMVDDLAEGRRPVVDSPAGRPLPTVEALEACPGVGLAHPPSTEVSGGVLHQQWGPVLEVWEGFAADDQLRFAGSSGGAASALALYAIEQEGMHGVLHIRARTDAPLLNETVLSTTREQVLGATGSRYAPASPCDRLDLVTNAPSPCVFIGKPCDVAATAKRRERDVQLDAKLGLTVAIFCAGAPSTRGSLEMLQEMGIEDPARVTELRYRGNGWPGDATATVREGDGTTTQRRLSYEASWGAVLQRHRQWRCYVCADHTGEFADIAVGDPWYRPVEPGDPGRNLLVVRTERGRSMLRGAVESGVIVATRVSVDRLPASQPGLQPIRGAVGGRIATLRLLGIPVPRYEGLPMWRSWLRDLSLRDKLRSTVGTLRRVRRRGLHRRRPVVDDADEVTRA